jgi:hypothetical protein
MDKSENGMSIYGKGAWLGEQATQGDRLDERIARLKISSGVCFDVTAPCTELQTVASWYQDDS